MALTLCGFGHVAATGEILDHVRQASIMDIYQTSRAVIRLRRGRYACAHLRVEELAALRLGGVLDCVSALAAWGAPIEPGIDVHVRFRPGSGRVGDRVDAAEFPVTAHWSVPRTPLPDARQSAIDHAAGRPVATRARMPIAEALRQALVCLPTARAQRVLDAVEGSGLLSEQRVARTLASAPRRTRAAILRLR